MSTTTAERIAAVHDRLAPLYPAIPRCYSWAPDRPDDYAWATWREMTPDRCAVLTFDVHWEWPLWVVAHELAHAMHANAGGWPRDLRLDDPVLPRFWEAAGFTTSWPDAFAYAMRTRRHDDFPGEHFADAFAYLTYRGFGGCLPQLYGGKWDDATLARLDAFYRSLRPEVNEVTEEQVRELLKGYVSKAEHEDYKRALQQQMDEQLAKVQHGHTATTTVS